MELKCRNEHEELKGLLNQNSEVKTHNKMSAEDEKLLRDLRLSMSQADKFENLKLILLGVLAMILLMVIFS